MSVKCKEHRLSKFVMQIGHRVIRNYHKMGVVEYMQPI